MFLFALPVHKNMYIHKQAQFLERFVDTRYVVQCQFGSVLLKMVGPKRFWPRTNIPPRKKKMKNPTRNVSSSKIGHNFRK